MFFLSLREDTHRLNNSKKNKIKIKQKEIQEKSKPKSYDLFKN